MNKSKKQYDKMLTDIEAAKYIGMSVQFLRKRRVEGIRDSMTSGPKYVRLGRAIRYQINELDSWILKNHVSGEVKNEIY